MPQDEIGPTTKGERVNDALVTTVIGVHEHCLPILWQAIRVNRISVVLWRYVATIGAQVGAGLVHPSIAELHLVCMNATSTSKDLNFQANAKLPG